MGTFGQPQVFSQDRTTAEYGGDVDADGDLDVVAVLTFDELVWYENEDSGFRNRPIDAAGYFVEAVLASNLDGDTDLDVLSGGDGISGYRNLSEVAAGDANGDYQFDQQDIVSVLQAAKYLTAEFATFAQGDWNGDGVFDQLDIVAALQTGNYLQGPYAVRSADAMFAEIGA